MCTAIYVDGREIDSMAALRALVGCDNLVIRGPGKYPPDIIDMTECCLCPVDVEATAAKAGYACEYDGCGDYVWTPPPSPAAADER